MGSQVFNLRRTAMTLAVALLWLGTAQAIAQTEPLPADSTELENAVSTDATNPPSYITEMIEAGELTQDQADLLRADGLGWGEVRIAVRIAEEISVASGGEVTFEDALAEVLTSLDSGLGFGEIAKQHDIDMGQLVGNREKKTNAAGQKQLETQQDGEQGAVVRTTERKRGFLARLGRFLGFGKKERTNQASSTMSAAASGEVEREQKTQKIEKAEKVEKMERPSKPEKPEKPAKPEKPEKPERGPNR